MRQLRVLYQDDSLVAVDKPAGFHVHPPEDETQKISHHTNSLYIVSRQLDRFLYPVHRLDRATSGVLVFGLTTDATRALAEAFRARQVQKTYYCVVRGWLDSAGTIARALKPEQGEGPQLESETRYVPLAKAEVPHANGQHPTSRYSLVKAEPSTGRFHQIRRHFAGSSHPLLGDSVHGDGIHNRIFRDRLEIPGLLLKAQVLEFSHPLTGQRMRIASRWDRRWHRVFELFGYCPWDQPP